MEREASRDNLLELEKLVQKFDYAAADAMLREFINNSHTSLIRFNMMLNLCREAEARRVIADVLVGNRILDEAECVMLRNASHLCDLESARSLLDRAHDAFATEIGRATTLNNRGVLELWDGNYSLAYEHLTIARRRLQKLGSFEVYQPLTNLAVLRFMEGKIRAARRYLREAKAATEKEYLPMDELMFCFNELVMNLAEHKISLGDATVEAHMLHERSIDETKDMRFQESIAWFAAQLAALVEKRTPPPHLGYEARIRYGKCCGVEVFKKLRLHRRSVTLLLQLSPHWRYSIQEVAIAPAV